MTRYDDAEASFAQSWMVIRVMSSNTKYRAISVRRVVVLHFHTTNMYTVSIEDKGGHPDSDISKVRECVISCLKPDPASINELKERLARELGKPEVMGRSYRLEI